MAYPHFLDAVVHPVTHDQAIQDSFHTRQLPVIFIERVRIIERAEVMIDSGLLNVGACAAPSDVRVLEAICPCAVSA